MTTKRFVIGTSEGSKIVEGQSFTISGGETDHARNSTGKTLKIRQGKRTLTFKPDEWSGFTEAVEEIKVKT